MYKQSEENKKQEKEYKWQNKKGNIWKCQKKIVSLYQTIEKGKKKTDMKVQWTALLDEAKGGVDAKHYARHIPGNGEWAAVCQKPELSNATKKKKAETQEVKAFDKMIAESKKIKETPERLAAWTAKYEADKREAKRHNKPIQGRLTDYIRHHVSGMLKRGEEVRP